MKEGERNSDCDGLLSSANPSARDKRPHLSSPPSALPAPQAVDFLSSRKSVPSRQRRSRYARLAAVAAVAVVAAATAAAAAVDDPPVPLELLLIRT